MTRSALRLLAALAAIALVCACADLRVSARVVDPGAVLPPAGTFRFAREALGPGSDPRARGADAAVRVALGEALGRHGWHEAGAGSPAGLRVDYVLLDLMLPNRRGLSSPGEYSQSWGAGAGGMPDGSGSMDHTIADAAFARELELRLMLAPEGGPRVAWEGSARRALSLDHPGGSALEPLLAPMCRALLERLPERPR